MVPRGRRACSGFARLIMMDKRGEGLSDGHGQLATFEDAIDDVRCVLDAVGSERAVVLVSTDACPLGILFAATHPDRVAGLVCREGWARPFSSGDESMDADGPRTAFMRDLLELVRREWGTGGFLSITVDGAPDEHDVAGGRGAMGTKRRDATAGRGTILDVRLIPTCVRCCRSCRVRRSWCTTAATSATRPSGVGTSPSTSLDGTFVELPYDKIYSWTGEAEHAALDHVERFVREELGVGGAPAQRQLMTVLFTDIVESTRAAREPQATKPGGGG